MLVGSLVVFSIGSLVTAASYDLTSMVVGRFLQGVGGGGLVPATLALVADIWAVERRGLPLGVVGAVQELGSVVGPLYGAVVLARVDLAHDLLDQPGGRARARGGARRALAQSARLGRRTASGPRPAAASGLARAAARRRRGASPWPSSWSSPSA